MPRVRLDKLLVDQGLAESRQKAAALIRAGVVLVDEVPRDKPGTQINPEAKVRLKENPLPYVSRGGLKLEAALDQFGVDPSGRTCADLGASTGGFTDCLLQRGAAKVFAVDVGYGQLAWSLRTDERVVVMERTNARHLESLPDPVSLIVGDLSFISSSNWSSVASTRSARWTGSESTSCSPCSGICASTDAISGRSASGAAKRR